MGYHQRIQHQDYFNEGRLSSQSSMLSSTPKTIQPLCHSAEVDARVDGLLEDWPRRLSICSSVDPDLCQKPSKKLRKKEKT